jgi:hypothetical protein
MANLRRSGAARIRETTGVAPGLYDPGMLVGRSREMDVLERLLDGARSGDGGAVVIHGEAGVGKSALLRFARDAARDFLVLNAVGIESEAELAFAGLHQLLHPVLGYLDALPDPQAAALRAAFGLSDETVAERFRISLGGLGLLATAAEERPVLCIADDAQWLDEASAAALLFIAAGSKRSASSSSVRLGTARRTRSPPTAWRTCSLRLFRTPTPGSSWPSDSARLRRPGRWSGYSPMRAATRSR